ncbi:hypothetical protein G7046_g7022 [Stylonectria norvegica]|nr:hypothetical protein G7046_g7022 [Stylonectria norvegica]
MPECCTICIQQSWPVFKHKAAWASDNPPGVNKRLKTSVYVKAWFDKHQGAGLVSKDFAGELLGGSVTSVARYIGIQWFVVGNKQAVVTTDLQVIQGLGCKIVLHTEFSEDGSAGLGLQSWALWTSWEEHGSQRGLIDSKDNNQVPITTGWSRSSRCENMDKSFLDDISQSEILSIAAEHGLLLLDPRSIEVFASFLVRSRRYSTLKTERNYISGDMTPSPTASTGISVEEYADSNASSPRYPGEAHFWYEQTPSSTATSRDFPFTPDSTPTKPCEATKAILSQRQTDALLQSNPQHSFDSDSTTSELFASTAPPNSAWDDESHLPIKVEDILQSSDRNVTRNHSPSEFEQHPGHKVWEWDPHALRWHKRGGDPNGDYFPEAFA